MQSILGELSLEASMDRPVTPDNPDILTLSLAEAVAATGIPERTIRTLVSTRRIPYIKVGKFLRFRPAELAAWLDASAVPAAGTKAS